MKDFEIPIFKKTYDLYRNLYNILKQFPRKDRYSLGQKCEETLLSILELFWLVNVSKINRLNYLKEANIKLNMLRVYLRLAKDIKALSLKSYTVLQEQIDEIGRMLGGWIKATERK